MDRAFVIVVPFSAGSGASLTITQPQVATPKLCLQVREALLAVLTSLPPRRVAWA